MATVPAGVRRIEPGDDAGLRSFVDITSAVTPESPMSLEEVAWSDDLYPGSVRFLASLDGRTVGAASVGRIYMYEATYERLWFGIHVLPEARRRGSGHALWTACSAVTREQGKSGLQTDVSERQVDGVAFLEHRGFEVIERAKMVQLALRGIAPPEVAPPDGFTITTLAERPDLEQGLYAVALEAYDDIPPLDDTIDVGPFDEFIARDVRREGMPPDAIAIGLDAVTGEVAGWASLMYVPGSTTMAWHDMTAVGRRWRGRGLATALKRATIVWAVGHGLEILETGNDVENAPMRAVNGKLGYRPIPDQLTLRGPLAPA
ncbi:MAG TPA: GNAT family N-acetyltransferase [Candidatus Limnocylindrales bacterium]|jgi:GNAT superfamily N-acetyltransferase